MPGIDTIKQLHPFELKILTVVETESFTISEISTRIDLSEAQTRSGINWLESKSVVAKKETQSIVSISLTDKGRYFAQHGVPELAIFRYIDHHPETRANDLMVGLPFEKQDTGSSFGYLKKSGQIVQNPNGTLSRGKDLETDYFEKLNNLLKRFTKDTRITKNQLSEQDREIFDQAANIQLHKGFFKLKESEIISYHLTAKGRDLKAAVADFRITGDEISQITSEMLKDKSWKNKGFREYNINLPAPHIRIGRKHPYREYLDFLKYTFVGLGFQEMRGSLVETEFWNMDALFMPQTHPARDIHDVYYINTPQYAETIEEPFFSEVAETHENGGRTQSRGWGYRFDKRKARQLILRSQGTVLSARALANQASVPGKYFSIARCFRYDKVDATHLADFYQVEGIVLSKDANISTLLGLLEIFAKEIAKAKEIKFVPGYFPFTEPSVEVYIKHPKLGWYEMGGSGIFRPEVTRPLGVDMPVLAWGMGVDRMAMMALGIDDIRDLFSRDLDLIRTTRMEI